MKKIACLLLVLVLIIILIPKGGNNAKQPDTDETNVIVSDKYETVNIATKQEEKDFKAIWVATVINLDYPSKTGLSINNLKSEADKILDDAKNMGFNAVVLQVRPSGDALYKSDYFPWSTSLTGTQGKAPADNFDPLTYWVNSAHERGLELHAWINPFRVTRTEADAKTLSSNNPAVKNPIWTVTHTNKAIYYNPGVPEVRTLIINGVKEIVKNYAVDGVHFDDYFYPGTSFADSTAFAKYGKGFANIADWRRDNVNKLIQGTYNAVKEINPDCDFGVSPVAIWANKKTNSLGSDTNGQQSYYEQFADTRKWVQSGWLDYVAPQIYWAIGKEGSDYSKVLSWWVDLIKNTNVKLYVGHATYLSGNTNATSPWYGTNEIVKQINLNKTYSEVQGSIHFRYKLIVQNSELENVVTSLNNDEAVEVVKQPETPATNIKMPVPTSQKLSVGRPNSNTTTTAANFYITGSSDPSQKLYINGVEITNRTAKGYFGYYATIKSGKNTFTFKQGQTTVTRVITKGGGSTTPATPMAKAEIVEGTAYPTTCDEYLQKGEKITLKCTAPRGSTVKVKINGQSYVMTAANAKKSTDGKNYPTTFSYVYTLPDTTQTGKVIDLGKPKYTMTLGNKISTRDAKGGVKCITSNAKIFAKVKNSVAFLFPKGSTSGGPIGELQKGQYDYITAIVSSGSWVRLKSGIWISSEDITIDTSLAAPNANLSDAEYNVGTDKDTFSLSSNAQSISTVTFDGGKLVWTVFETSTAPQISLPDDSMFASATTTLSGTKAVYTFILKQGTRLEGYYVDSSNTNFVLNLKRTKQLSNSDKPLDGFTIVVDAGHGGTDTGALGAHGVEYSEEYFNLYASLKLEEKLTALGANVIMTRKTDVALSLNDRLVINRNARPDLFISLHCNSLDYSTNAESVRGVSTWFKENTSSIFSKNIVEHLKSQLSLGKRDATQQNLYVCRSTWSPATIIEMGFICNPADYQWLIDDNEQTKFINSLANGVVEYFR